MANELKFGNKVIFLGGQPLTLPIATADPGVAANGDMYYNSTANRIRVYQNGGWTDLATGSAGISAGVAGRLALYPSNGSSLDDQYSQNSNLIDVEIAAQPSRSSPLSYVFPNPGDAISSASVILSEGDQTLEGALTLNSDLFLTSLDPSLPLKLDGSNQVIAEEIDLTSEVSGILPIANGGTNSAAALSNNRVMQSSGGAIVEAAAITAARALISDANGIPTHSAVTATELGYVSGVTSAIQTQINAKANDNIVIKKDGSVAFLANQSMGGFKLTSLADGTNPADAVNLAQLQLYIPLTQKGAAGGVATLDGGGKVPVAQLPNSIMEYQGMWDASTNTPTLADGVGNTGDVWRVSVAGTQDLGSGDIDFMVGDYAIYNTDGVWEKADTTDSVVSVNGMNGVVILDSDDISEGSTNLYFTNERAQDAVGSILTDSSTIDFTYNDAGNTISADIVAGSISNAHINAAAAIALTKLAALTNHNRALQSDGSGFISESAVTSTELGYLSGVTSAIQTQLNGKANTALSNLASVAINTSLLSDTDNTDDLGSDAIEWKDLWIHSIKHNSSGAPNLGISTTGNNGSLILTAHGTGNLDILATKIRRAENGAGSDYMEDQYFDALTLDAGTVAATEIDSDLSFAVADFDGAVINYRIKEDTTNKVRIGQFYVSSDGTVASSSDQFSETSSLGSALGLSFSADVDSGNVRILYNNTHASNDAVMRCQIRRFRV